VFDDSGATYGSPPIGIELREQGWQVSDNTIALAMAELGLAGRAGLLALIWKTAHNPATWALLSRGSRRRRDHAADCPADIINPIRLGQ
jgi:hypothetical protein